MNGKLIRSQCGFIGESSASHTNSAAVVAAWRAKETQATVAAEIREWIRLAGQKQRTGQQRSDVEPGGRRPTAPPLRLASYPGHFANLLADVK